MSERLNSDLDNQQKFSVRDRAKKVIAGALVAVTLSGPLAAEVRAETPAPADPNTTHSTETTEVTNGDNMPDVEVETPAPADPLKEIQFPKVTILTDDDKEDLSCRIVDPEADLLSLEELSNAIASYKQEITSTSNGDYLKKLRDYGCTETNPEILMSYIGVLSAIDSSKKKDAQGNPTNYSTLSKYVSEESVLKYSVDKEGLNFYSVDNSPPILIVGGNDKTNKNLVKSFEWYKENGNFDIPDFLRKNGVYILWFSEFDKKAGYGAAAIYESGIIRFNFDAKDAKKYKDSGLLSDFKYIFTTEAEGIPIMSLIRSLNLDLNNGYIEVAKSLLAQEDSLNMYKNTGAKFYLDLNKEMEGMAVNFSEQYNVSLDDPKLIRLIDVVTSSNLSQPLSSDNWGFYKS